MINRKALMVGIIASFASLPAVAQSHCFWVSSYEWGYRHDRLAGAHARAVTGKLIITI